MPIHFISDLHLSAEQPALNQLFIHYLQHQAPDADALFILGDLFEVWLGDDMVLEEYQEIIASLQTLTRSFVPVYIMYGNRDFLMREKFEQLTGCQLINDPTVIDLYGTQTLLMHGDTLCTDDEDYQNFRTMVRDKKWQDELLSKTPEQRLALAREYREQSKAATSNKSNSIMDVNQQQVNAVMQQYKVSQLIHGHTHRPATHQLNVNGDAAVRIVLSDWNDFGQVLVCDESGCNSQTIQI